MELSQLNITQNFPLMYGMVNKAVEDLIIAHHGSAIWDRIRSKANVKEEVFISNESYPDAVTYDLVAAASEVLGQPAEEILFAFGEWWILKTAREGYGALMQAGGGTFGEFMINLPNFHTRVAMIFSKLHPPLFRCSNIESRSLHLHYLSHRQGLAPFVCGLISGLGKMFSAQVEVMHLERKDEGADHDVFHVSWHDEATTPGAEAE